MTADSTVTVIVAIYDVAPYIDECVASLVAQTWHDIDIILVDDGSRDGSGERCDAWAARDSRVHVIHQTNAGLSAARNAGLARARGPWVTFVDGDDIVAPEFVATLLAVAQRDGVDVVSGGLVPFAEQLPDFALSDAVTTMTARHALAVAVDTGLGWESCGKLWRRDLFSSEAMFRPSIRFEDLDVFPRVLHPADLVSVSASALYGYRQRPTSIMGRARRRLDPDLFDVLQTTIQVCSRLYGDDPDYVRALHRGLFLHATKTLEAARARGSRLGRGFGARYRRFVLGNLSVLRQPELGALYRAAIVVSVLSPAAFVELMRTAHTLKRTLLPSLRRSPDRQQPHR